MDELLLIGTPGLEINLTCTVNGGTGSIVDIIWDGPSTISNPPIIEYSDGVFTSSLILSDATMFNSGNYECTAKYNNDLCPSNISSGVRLDVVAPPYVIQQTPTPVILERGANIDLEFKFASHPNFTDVQCSGPTSDITSSMTVLRVDNDTLFQIRLSISIPPVDFTHGGQYSCTANNTAGNIESSVLILIVPIAEPEQVLTRNGNTATLLCLAQSLPELTYTWEMSSMLGTGLGNGSVSNLYTTFEEGSGGSLAMQPILDFTPVQYEDGGYYRCVVNVGMFNVPSNEVMLAGNKRN